MKKIFKNYLEKEIAKNQQILSTNSLAEEDRAVVEAAIKSLEETMEAVDAAEESTEAIDELKQLVAGLQEGLTAVKEKINQQTKEEEKIPMETMENYLKTKNSVADFISVIKNSKSVKEFQNGWNQMLTTNGIEITEGSEFAYLPDFVKGRIQDMWDRNASWLADLRNTGSKRYTVRVNTSEQDAETSRAKGWKRGETKVSQELTFAAKQVIPQFIYKIQEIDIQTEFESDEDLMRYIMEELVSQILYEEKRAILVGDGREVSDPLKINSFETILKDTSDIYTEVITAEADSFVLDNIVALVDALHNPDNRPVYVFMSKETLRGLRRVAASETSTPVYLPVEQVAETIGAAKIFTTDLLGEDATAIAMIPEKYCLVGANVFNPELTTQHDIYTNTNVYRYECAAGGAIEGLKSTAVLLPAGE